MTDQAATIVFIHLPKTGGTTVKSLLMRAIKPLFSINDREDLQNFLSLPASAREEFRLIAGHLPYGIHYFISRPVKYITILRDPVKRVVSAYNYVKMRPDHPLHARLGNGSLSDYLTMELDNQLVRRLGHYDLSTPERNKYWWYSLGQQRLTEQHLEIAKETLAACSFIGFQESLDSDITELFENLCLPIPATIPKLLAGNRSGDEVERDLETAPEIREHVYWDIQLFDFAHQLKRKTSNESGAIS